MRIAVVAAVAGVLLSGLVAPVTAGAASSSPEVAWRRCVTGKKAIVKQLRRENAYPVVRGIRRKHVRACRGRWAVITRSSLGDASFNARYRRGRWHFHAGYPMRSCRGVPRWLCPRHP